MTSGSRALVAGSSPVAVVPPGAVRPAGGSPKAAVEAAAKQDDQDPVTQVAVVASQSSSSGRASVVAHLARGYPTILSRTDLAACFKSSPTMLE